MSRERNDVAEFCRLVAAELRQRGEDHLARAVSSVCRRNPELALAALETIGSYPSSEPELAELQRQWRG